MVKHECAKQTLNIITSCDFIKVMPKLDVLVVSKHNLKTAIHQIIITMTN